MNSIKEFLYFLRNPVDRWHPNQSMGFKLKTFGILFVFTLVVMFLLLIPITLLEKTGSFNTEDHAIVDLLTETTPLQILFLAAFIGPLIEEILFRFFLKYERSIFRLIGNSEEGRQKARAYWDKNFKRYFYVSALVFGLIHISNYLPMNLIILLLAPILCLPQIFFGAVAGYLRVRFGFFWGLLLHCLNNLVMVGAVLLSLNTPIEKANIDNNDYSIHIQEIQLQNNQTKSSSNGASSESNYDGETKSSQKYELNNYSILDIYYYTNKETSGKTKLLANEMKNKKFNVSLEIKNDSIDHKEIIKKEIEKAYELEYVLQKKVQPEWTLGIQDSSLLMQHSVQDSLLENFSSKKVKKQMHMKSHNSKQLAIWLNNKYLERIKNGISIDDKFDIKIPLTRNFKTMQDSLKINYGLELTKGVKQVEHYVIRKKTDEKK